MVSNRKQWKGIGKESRRIRLACLHTCCYPIQIIRWFIWEVTIVLFVHTPTQSVACGKLHNSIPPRWIIKWPELAGNKEVNTLEVHGLKLELSYSSCPDNGLTVKQPFCKLATVLKLQYKTQGDKDLSVALVLQHCHRIAGSLKLLVTLPSN